MNVLKKCSYYFLQFQGNYEVDFINKVLFKVIMVFSKWDLFVIIKMYEIGVFESIYCFVVVFDQGDDFIIQFGVFLFQMFFR